MPIVTPGVLILPLLNPEASPSVMGIHPDGTVEGGPTPVVDSYVGERMSCAAYSRPESGQDFRAIDLTSPTLQEIHCAGFGQDPARVLEQFNRDLRVRGWVRGSFPLKRFSDLWREHDHIVSLCSGTWRHSPEYLDLSRPLFLDEQAARLASDSGKRDVSVIRLHHQIRKSLAAERDLCVTVRTGAVRRIRYVATHEVVPVREGTIAVPVAEIDRVIAHVEGSTGVVNPLDRLDLREGVARLFVLGSTPQMPDWDHPRTSAGLARRHFSGSHLQRRLALIHALLIFQGSGRNADEIFAALPHEATLWDFFQRAADGIGIPTIDLIGTIKGDRAENWMPKERPSEIHFPEILKVMNVLSVRRPWEILDRLFPEELRWAFPDRSDDGTQWYASLDSGKALESIARGGFGALLTRERLAREWSCEELMRRTRNLLGAPVSVNVLGRYGSNASRPSLPVLRAIVEALNGHPTVPPVDPAVAFLAWNPSFISLLPVANQSRRRLLVRAIEAPFQVVPYPEPRESAVPRVLRRQSPRDRIDPQGFPFLIGGRRLELGLTFADMGRRLGISAAQYSRLEREPEADGMPSEVPGAMAVWVLCQDRDLQLSAIDVARALMHSHWRKHPTVRALNERTFRTPVFVDPASLKRLETYLRYEFQTVGEILYWWRSGVGRAVEQGRLQFPVTSKDMMGFLGVSRKLYKGWETNAILPSEVEILEIASRLERSQLEKELLLGSVRKMREFLARPGEGAIQRLVALAAHRPHITKAATEELRERLDLLTRQDPESLAFIDRVAEGLSDPASPELARLVFVIHKTAYRIANWPASVSRQGPVAAIYYFQKPASPEIRRFKEVFRSQGPKRLVIDPSDGTYRLLNE